MLIRLSLICAFAAALLGCSTPPGGFDSPVPAKRMDAAVMAARDGDESSIPDLIQMLDSDDALVRMVAIQSLRRLTGENLGYDHAAHDWERSAAVDRWTAWATAQGHAPVLPEDSTEDPTSQESDR